MTTTRYTPDKNTVLLHILTRGQANKLRGENALVIMGVWRREAMRAGVPSAEINKTFIEAKSGDYEHLCMLLGIPV